MTDAARWLGREDIDASLPSWIDLGNPMDVDEMFTVACWTEAMIRSIGSNKAERLLAVHNARKATQAARMRAIKDRIPREVDATGRTTAKRCSACHRVLPRDDFYQESTARDGLGKQCKECRREDGRNRRHRKRSWGYIPQARSTPCRPPGGKERTSD